MNKVLKQIDYKIQIAVLASVVLVGVMFLVPTITQKAIAIIFGTLTGNCLNDRGFYMPCTFLPLQKDLKNGQWSKVPVLGVPCVSPCTWATEGRFFNHNEEGTIVFQVLNSNPALNDVFKVYFYNPAFGSNKCDIVKLTEDFHYWKKCDATPGIASDMTYGVSQPCLGSCITQGVGSTNDKVAIGENGGGNDGNGVNGGNGGDATAHSGSANGGKGGHGGSGGIAISHSGNANGGYGGAGGN